MKFCLSEGIVLFPLFRITEYGVGLVNLLEALFGSLVTLVLIRMILEGLFPERLLNLLGRGTLFNAKYLVIVFHNPLITLICFLLLVMTLAAPWYGISSTELFPITFL